MAKEKTRDLNLILSYQLGLNKSLLCSGLDLDGNDGTQKLNVLFIYLSVCYAIRTFQTLNNYFVLISNDITTQIYRIHDFPSKIKPSIHLY